jgi:cytidylate kinase
MIIAIDGPVGSGKSTAARLLAARLGYRYIDSGAMYRALAWRALEAGVRLTDERGLRRLAEAMTLTFERSSGRLLVHVDGREISRQIREPEVEQASSKISTLAGVRRVLVDRQRKLGARGGVVMDGRDIGTVVFPNADVKFYLDARLKERAGRRYREARAAGETRAFREISAQIKMRDARDRRRRESPLRKAVDAVTIDTTNLSPSQVVAAMQKTIRMRASAPRATR